MKRAQINLISVFLLIGTFLASCGGFSPPQNCGENIGGVADDTKFAQYFVSMQLINQFTGQPGVEGENGAQFATKDSLAIIADSISIVALRVCVQHRGGPGVLPFDQTKTLAQGQVEVPIGSLEPGTYVIRVIIDNTLIHNFPLEVK